VRTPAYNNCVRRRHYAKTFGKEATEWEKVQTRTGVNRISKGDERRELTYSCGTVSLTLEALTLALGALIGVSGGLAATHRPGKDVRENPDRGIAKILPGPVLVEIWIELDVALWGQFQQLFPSHCVAATSSCIAGGVPSRAPS